MSHIDTSPVVRGSVWILPAGDALDRIEHATNLVHKRGGGPRFRPHLTLLSGLETTEEDAGLKLRHLASRIRPFEVRLGRIEWRQEYFRCLYVAAALSDELAAARREAYDVFEMNPPPPFEPHVSLLYGNLDESLKTELAAEAGGGLDVAFMATGVHLVNSASSVPVATWKTLAQRQFTS
ncbi:MAG TPA: 2'-5' RNA ligase family protein [Burkholderiales bacterium]|nr:2'-5' RNA ligase family protein [Burkholderiales bacterium]